MSSKVDVVYQWPASNFFAIPQVLLYTLQNCNKRTVIQMRCRAARLYIFKTCSTWNNARSAAKFYLLPSGSAQRSPSRRIHLQANENGNNDTIELSQTASPTLTRANNQQRGKKRITVRASRVGLSSRLTVASYGSCFQCLYYTITLIDPATTKRKKKSNIKSNSHPSHITVRTPWAHCDECSSSCWVRSPPLGT